METIERKIDNCYNFNKEIGCVQDVCRCEKEESKQEMLSKKIANEMDVVLMDFSNGVETSMRVFYKVLKKLHSEAIEQEKKMYSEEEILDIFFNFFCHQIDEDVENKLSFQQFIKQFKKQ
jgi:hypothetical protein